jgi:hypothetical protein
MALVSKTQVGGVAIGRGIMHSMDSISEPCRTCYDKFELERKFRASICVTFPFRHMVLSFPCCWPTIPRA